MKITILGVGAYALALSKILIENKNEVTIWTQFEEEKEELLKTKKSSKLKGFKLDSKVNITTNLEESISFSKLIIIAIPTQFISDVCKKINKYIKNDQHICIASKGIEQEKCLFIHEIVKEQIKTKKIAVISGPSFAIDLINNIPVGLSIASKNTNTIKVIEEAFLNDYFVLNKTNDIIGVEICGSVKNIIAIASGIIDGLGYPISTKATFITKSLNDIKGLINLLGGSNKTILSYAGFGDILLTCTSEKSRNYSFGKMIGSKVSKKTIDDYKNNATIEGLHTLNSIHKLLKSKNINIKLIDTMYDIIFKGEKVENIVYYIIK